MAASTLSHFAYYIVVEGNIYQEIEPWIISLMKSNVLYFGNNLSVLRDRNRIPENSVDLIYLDPPFNSNRNYFVLFKDRTGKSSAAHEQAFEDTWSWTEETETLYKELITTCPNQNLVITAKALREFLKESPIMAYLVAMAIRLIEMHSTLKETGTLYLHCDPTASHYLKIILDAIFSPLNFKNEIVWKRVNSKGNVQRKFGSIHDIILCYVKKKGSETWNQIYRPLREEYIESTYNNVEVQTGRRYSLDNLTASMQRASKGQIYAWKGKTPPPTRCWIYAIDRMVELEKEGRLVYSKTGYPRYKRYLDENPGEKVPDIWDDIHQISPKESLGYPT